jgi:enterochelin esterase-like enzyme
MAFLPVAKKPSNFCFFERALLVKNNIERRHVLQSIVGLAAVSALPLGGCATSNTLEEKVLDEGRFVTHDNFISRYAVSRRVVVWLPPGYDRDAVKNTRHAVLYMHDGQNLFDPQLAMHGQPWAADKKIAALMRSKKMKSTIVVGIDNSPYRSREYAPVAAVATLSKPTIEAAKYDTEPLLSDGYLNFLALELKPFIDRVYRTLPDAANTATMGASMGGLISLYALIKFPAVFGAAGCMSTHWPFATARELVGPPPSPAGAEIAENFMQWLQKNLPRAGKNKLYFDHGTINLDALYAPYQQRVDAMLKAQGYRAGEDWITVVEPGADHNETAWRGRLDVPLQLFFKS